MPRWFSNAVHRRETAAAADSGNSEMHIMSSTGKSGSTLPCAIAPATKTTGESDDRVGTYLAAEGGGRWRVEAGGVEAGGVEAGEGGA